MKDPWAWAGLALPGAAMALLLIGAVGGRGSRHARVEREGGTVFLGKGVMNLGYLWVERLASLAMRLRLGASAISWISLGLGALSGWLAGGGCLAAAAWALALSGLCDGVDGAVARRDGTATPAGSVLDSALDRYVEFFFCAGLVYYFRGSALAQLTVLFALFGGFMVTYSTAKAEALGIRPPRGWMKRPERLVWLIAGASLAEAAPWAGLEKSAPVLLAAGVVAVFSNLSAVRRLWALSRSPGSS
jgi:CDP-diacylglycerol--glycerol-3-phosphate 3-phosphatidyltransferase